MVNHAYLSDGKTNRKELNRLNFQTFSNVWNGEWKNDLSIFSGISQKDVTTLPWPCSLTQLR